MTEYCLKQCAPLHSIGCGWHTWHLNIWYPLSSHLQFFRRIPTQSHLPWVCSAFLCRDYSGGSLILLPALNFAVFSSFPTDSHLLRPAFSAKMPGTKFTQVSNPTPSLLFQMMLLHLTKLWLQGEEMSYQQSFSLLCSHIYNTKKKLVLSDLELKTLN